MHRIPPYPIHAGHTSPRGGSGDEGGAAPAGPAAASPRPRTTRSWPHWPASRRRRRRPRARRCQPPRAPPATRAATGSAPRRSRAASGRAPGVRTGAGQQGTMGLKAGGGRRPCWGAPLPWLDSSPGAACRSKPRKPRRAARRPSADRRRPTGACSRQALAVRTVASTMRLSVCSSTSVSVVWLPVVIQSSWWCSVSLYTCCSVSAGHMRRRSGVMSKPCAPAPGPLRGPRLWRRACGEAPGTAGGEPTDRATFLPRPWGFRTSDTEGSGDEMHRALPRSWRRDPLLKHAALTAQRGTGEGLRRRRPSARPGLQRRAQGAARAPWSPCARSRPCR